MSVDECITAYIQLSSRVFQKKHFIPVTIRGNVKARYSSKELQRAIEEVIEAQHLDKDALLKDNSIQACKVFVLKSCSKLARLTGYRFVCANSKGVSLPFLLRSYPPTRESPDLYHSTKIWEAGRATFAASSFFQPIALESLGQEFLDGGTGANNPVRQLWKEAADTFCDGSSRQLSINLRTIVSIGTGTTNLTEFGDDPLAEAQITANDFHREHSDLDDEGKYYRFNVARGFAAFGVEEATDATRIKEKTDAYLNEQSIHSLVRKCARALGDAIVPAPTNSQQSMSTQPRREGFTAYPEYDS